MLRLLTVIYSLKYIYVYIREATCHLASNTAALPKRTSEFYISEFLLVVNIKKCSLLSLRKCLQKPVLS
jgi:hypothetical protein